MGAVEEGPRGVLGLRAGQRSFEVTRSRPGAGLAELVEHYWTVRWDLTGRDPHTQHTLPHPSVHLVAERDRSGIMGVLTGRFTRELEGQGRAFIELSGELVTYGLHPGQTMLVHPGHVGMFEGSVQFQVTRIPGVANKMFGGDGYHLVALTGPGQIWLQSMPLSSLAHAIEPYLPVAGDVAAGAAGGGLANMMMRD